MFPIHEITNIQSFDHVTKQIENYANSMGVSLDHNRSWIKAHALITEIEWRERKATHMTYRRIQALLHDAIREGGVY